MFVIPSVICGFVFSIPCIMGVWHLLYSEQSGIKPSIFPGLFASLQALALGVFIPTLSSIIPVKRAIQKPLIDSLNTQRSKNSGVLVTITNNESKNTVPYLLFGTVTVCFGISIYYVMPLALISQSLGLILIIFLIILLGMMTGLTLFASNF